VWARFFQDIGYCSNLNKGLFYPFWGLRSCKGLRQLMGHANEIPLLGTRWVLRSIKGRELWQGTIITIQFLNRTQLTGSDECSKNGWGRYKLHSDSQLTIMETGNHQIGCAGSIGTQEYEYTIKLLGITHYKIEGTVLSLFNESKGILLQYQLLSKTKANPENLLGKTWQLVSATGLGKSGLSAFTLQFDANQFDFNGATICRTYQGTYHMVDEALGVFSIRRKVGVFDYFLCRRENTLAEESYLELLKNVWRYEVSETQLELYADHDRKLVFKLTND
ncbi:META domain-containing protein, partial [Methyloglobulus sp.]|uniref:META domain-containing protein n=1 Tax=Methyloglobulus sp. TaxID=2518622 RepID=UPI0032B7E33C